MSKRYLFAILILVVVVATMAAEAKENEERQVPVVVSAEVKGPVRAGEAIPMVITVSNGLASAIYHSTFSVTPTEWNGETCNVSLVDIHRDDRKWNLYRARPKVEVPKMIAGARRWQIEPGKRLEIQTDAHKWTLRDGWLPGRYTVTVRVDRIRVDKWCSLSVLSDPCEFEVR